MCKLKRSECAILPLVLKRRWYDMIDRGEKRESLDTPTIQRYGRKLMDALEGMAEKPDEPALMEPNDLKAMREALEFVAHIDDSSYTTYDVLVAVQKARAALAAPPRNCDRYSHDEALSVWAAEKENGKNGCFDEWLYAPATEQKGEQL